MDVVYFETKQFNHRNRLIRYIVFLTIMFCIKIIHYDVQIKNNKMLFNKELDLNSILYYLIFNI